MTDDAGLPDLTQIPLDDLFKLDLVDLPGVREILQDGEAVIACE